MASSASNSAMTANNKTNNGRSKSMAAPSSSGGVFSALGTPPPISPRLAKLSQGSVGEDFPGLRGGSFSGLGPAAYGRNYSVVRVDNTSKHGLLHLAIPTMPLPLACLFCLFNIVVPGLGSLCASFTCFCCGTTRVGKPLKGFALNLLSALLQMLTFLIIVGWIWSILWGMTFVQLSLSAKRSHGGSPLPYYVRRQSSVE